MESNELNQKSLEISQPGERVPDTLLGNVLSRLEQRQAYMQANLPAQDLIAGLNHPAWEIRTAALQALDSSSTTDRLQLLLAALEDEHRLVRVAALRALSHMGNRAPLEPLLHSLHDNDWEVREMAVLCLSEINTQETDLISSLLHLAQHDPYSTVRDAAQTALVKRENNQAHTSPQSPPTITIDPEIARIPIRLPELARQTTQAGKHYAVVLKRQIAIIHKSVWFGSLGIMLFGSILSIMGMSGAHSNLQNAISYLALFMCISAAAGTAFLYGSENDLALELTLSTPTSIRMIMLFRFMLVLGYNILLAACSSIAIAILHGGGLWEVIQCWLGPMILVSSVTFSIPLLLGSWFSLLISLVTTVSHLLSLNIINQPLPNIDIVMTNNGQINPLLFCGALLLLLAAISYAPRQPRLSTN